MKINSHTLLIMAAFIGLLSSCGPKNVDDTAPTLAFIALSPEPTPDFICGAEEQVVFHVRSGDTLSLDLRLSDDVELSQYKVDIHTNFDCHGHKMDTEDWVVLQTGNLSGKEYLLQLRLPVPANVTAGNYHFQIQVLDKAGNDNPTAYVYAIKVLNAADTTPPALNISSPVVNSGDMLVLRKGQNITFTGNVADNRPLAEGGNGKVEIFYRSNASGNTFRWGSPLVFTAADDDYKDFSLTLPVPNTAANGDYVVTVWAYDGVNNAAPPIIYSARITN